MSTILGKQFGFSFCPNKSVCGGLLSTSPVLLGFVFIMNYDIVEGVNESLSHAFERGLEVYRFTSFL